MFDLYGTERLTNWKQFRDSLEVSKTPLEDVAELWSHAPFVSPYLDPQNPAEWPDPWQLILDLKLDDLAICLGMLYTIKLTQRFMDIECEIHTSMLSKEFNKKFFLVVDNKHVLNYTFGSVDSLNVLDQTLTDKIWSGHKLP